MSSHSWSAGGLPGWTHVFDWTCTTYWPQPWLCPFHRTGSLLCPLDWQEKDKNNSGGRDDSLTKIRACTLTLHSHCNEFSRLPTSANSAVRFHFYALWLVGTHTHTKHVWQYETIQLLLKYNCVAFVIICGISPDGETPPALEGLSSVWLALRQGLTYIHCKVAPVLALTPAVVTQVNRRRNGWPGSSQVPDKLYLINFVTNNSW